MTTYPEMSGDQSGKSYIFLFEIPLHVFCCAYLERQNVIVL